MLYSDSPEPKQTFHRHLREAQRRVAQFIIEELDDDRLGISANAELDSDTDVWV